MGPLKTVKKALQAYVDKDRAAIVYEAKSSAKTFRNTEVHRVRDGKLVATEVYFGWDLPHPASPGTFLAESS